MVPGRKLFMVEKEYFGEKIECIYGQQLKPLQLAEFEALTEEEKAFARPYPFNQRTYQAAPGIVCHQDVAVPMRDGVELYADIFMPENPGEKVPAILAWSNYGKRCNEFRPPELVGFTPGVPVGAISEMCKFEAPDPSYWCRHNYAVINVDIRGIGYSGGLHDQFGLQDAQDGYDFIEWVAAQDWCNGRVAMSGSSALAISQYHIAAQQPPHLACIAPWEGMSDMYRESLYEGGIPCIAFTDFATAGAAGLNGIDDQGGMARKYPLMNGYWKNKIPPFEKIQCPMYITAGWNHFHLRGTINAWRKAGSKLKWLRAHREFEWPDFYTPENIEDLRRFFDRYCKGIHNGWEMTPRVRLGVMDVFDQDFAVNRPENEFPLARTEYQRLYLNAATGRMEDAPVAEAAQVSYNAQDGLVAFDYTFAQETELTGYPFLRVWAEAQGHDDMDLIITVKKLSAEGVEQPVTLFNGTAPHPGAWGKMRVSHRELDPELSTPFNPVQAHTREQKLSEGEVVPCNIEITPLSRVWHAGETLRVTIAGRYIRDPHWIEPLMLETNNQGTHVIHAGANFDSFLQIPVAPPKYTASTVFAVDEEAHPSHPIFT